MWVRSWLTTPIQRTPRRSKHDSGADRGHNAYKRGDGQALLSIGAPVSANLAAALRAYHVAFGHEVPSDIVDKYAGRSGPLMLEIRQAVELKKPVQAWLARSKVSTPPP